MYVYLISYWNTTNYEAVQTYYGAVFSTKAKAEQTAKEQNLYNYKIVRKKVI